MDQMQAAIAPLHEILLHKCSKSELDQGCISIPSYLSKKNEIINGNYLCVKRSQESYKDLLESNKIVSKNSKCPENYVNCGIVDTFGNNFCAENNESCPITMEYLNKIFQYKLQNVDEYEPFTSEYNHLNLNNDKSQILSVFQLGERNPCIYPGETYWQACS